MKKHHNFNPSPIVLIFAISLVYSISLSILITAVPLFMDFLDISTARIGLYLSITGMVQIALRIPIGMVADSYGEKRILVLCVLTMTFAGFIYIWGYVYIAIIILAQLLTGFSRAVFWPVSQSYLSKTPGEDLGKKIGLFHTLVSIGPVIGPMLTGFLLSYYSYREVFMTLVAVTMFCVPLVFALPGNKITGSKDKKFNLKSNFIALSRLVKIRSVVLSCFSQYAGALPLALLGSFLPIYYNYVGFSSEVLGMIVSSFGVFLLLANLYFSNVFKKLPHHLAWMVGMTGAGLAIMAIPLFVGVIPSIICIALMGIASSPLRILPIIMTSQSTDPSERGLAIAFTNTFWGFSLWMNPLLFGLIVNKTSFHFAFSIIALPLLILSLFTKQLFKPSGKQGIV